MIINNLINRMHYSSEVRNIVSRNIANINTPGFLTKKVEDFKSSNKANENHIFSLNLTNFKHFSTKHIDNYSVYKVYKDYNKKHMKLDGNNIDLESESLKYTKNDIKYEEYLLLFKKWTSIMQNLFSNVTK